VGRLKNNGEKVWQFQEKAVPLHRQNIESFKNSKIISLPGEPQGSILGGRSSF
jgi:hypothetical protein